MNLTRRKILQFAALAPFASVFAAGSAMTLQGYLTPFSRDGKTFLLTPTPMHCPDCYRGARNDIALVCMASRPEQHGGKVRVTGSITQESGHALAGRIVEAARLVKASAKNAFL